MAHLKFDDTLVCHDCSWLPTQAKPVLTFPTDLWNTWQRWTRVHADLEILALGKVEDGRVVALHLPSQEIETTACELKEQNGHYDLQIHSHHSMGASFSSMDKSTVLPNYRFSIVTNHDGKYEAAERVELPCGGFGFKPINIAVEICEADALADAAAAALVTAQCSKPKPKISTQSWYGGDIHKRKPEDKPLLTDDTCLDFYPDKEDDEAEAIREIVREEMEDRYGQIGFASDRRFRQESAEDYLLNLDRESDAATEQYWRDRDKLKGQR